MKSLQNLKGAHLLSKQEQQSINGGGGKCTDSCVGLAIGDRCWHQNSCLCPGQCTSQGCQPI